ARAVAEEDELPALAVAAEAQDLLRVGIRAERRPPLVLGNERVEQAADVAPLDRAARGDGGALSLLGEISAVQPGHQRQRRGRARGERGESCIDCAGAAARRGL